MTGAPVESAAGRQPTVVFIEDDPLAQMLLSRAFAHRTAMRLVPASTGEEGLALAASCGPDLILQDMHLPDLHGLEILARLKADPVTAAIPVVVLSGTSEPAQIDAARSAGAAEFLVKPYDLATVLALAERLVGS